MKKYMVVESFRPNCCEKIYQRFKDQGRLLPDELIYLQSWLSADGNKCFQLMETDYPELFQIWTDRWSDLTEFEIVEIGDKPNFE